MELPVWPDRLVSAEAAKQRILQDMEMQPIITTLYPSIYDMEGRKISIGWFMNRFRVVVRSMPLRVNPYITCSMICCRRLFQSRLRIPVN